MDPRPRLPFDSTASPPRTMAAIERVEQWTVEQAADVLGATSLSSPLPRQIRGAAVAIDIPLDTPPPAHDAPARPPKPDAAAHTVYKRREPIRRDSQKRREALLKGKEGSRRRQRWENDRLLLSNPHATPPLPSDWQVQPTHPVQRVPYFLAPLWDAGYARAAHERQTRAHHHRHPDDDDEAARVPRELRAKLKRAKGAKGLLQDLEEEVRGFVRQWEAKQRQLESDGLIEPDSDDDDDEIVFVGRNGAMSDERRRGRESALLDKDKKVYESLVDDHGAAFGRYLVHAIGMYYGLKTWSVTTGNPARREAYVGLKIHPTTRRPSLTRSELPQPLWAVV